MANFSGSVRQDYTDKVAACVGTNSLNGSVTQFDKNQIPNSVTVSGNETLTLYSTHTQIEIECRIVWTTKYLCLYVCICIYTYIDVSVYIYIYICLYVMNLVKAIDDYGFEAY